MASLQKKQAQFSVMFGKLLDFAYTHGYEVTLGDAWAFDLNPVIRYLLDIAKYLPDWQRKKMRPLLTLLYQHRHKQHSNHYNRLAVDINLFKNGKYLTRSEDHLALGEFWESMGGSWGGRFVDEEGNPQPDGNHYSLEFGGRK